MPFSLNIAPWVFNKLCSVIIKELCQKGIKIFAYLDDWILWALSPFLCHQAFQIVCQTIQKYGFIINAKKPSLILM